jgi:hypothetical protein
MNAGLDVEALLETLAEKVASKLVGRITSPAQPAPRLLNVQQAAVYLGCSPHSIRHQLKAGKLPSVRRDRRVFLDVKDLDRLIDNAKDLAV